MKAPRKSFPASEQNVPIIHASLGIFDPLLHSTMLTVNDANAVPNDGGFSSSRPSVGFKQISGNISAERWKTFECYMCKRQISSKRTLVSHFHKFHTGILLFKCAYDGCQKSFASRALCGQHEKTHRKKIYKCNHHGCDKSFKNGTLLWNHEKMHERIFQCDKIDCGKPFKSEKNLKLHKKVHSLPSSNSKDPQQTDHWTSKRSNFKYFNFSGNFRISGHLNEEGHLRILSLKKYSKVNRYKYLTKLYRMKQYAKSRNVSNNNSETNACALSCKTCAEVFDQEETLNLHLKEHRVACEICDEFCDDENSRREHIDQNHTHTSL